MMVRRRAFMAMLLLAVPASCKKDGAGSGAGKKLRIAVIPKGTTHEFWKTVHAGAVKAGREADAEVVWKGPLKEDDLKSQIELVQSFVAQGVSGIVLAPLSDTALRNPVQRAQAAGIPVVIFDSDLKGDAHAAFVATDNLQAGAMAAEQMAKLLDGKGNVIVLRYQEGSASTMNREKGFLDAIAQHPDIKVVSANQYAGATTETAFSTSESLLMAQSAATAVQGIFTPNESTTFGMLLALRKAGLAGKLRFIGFDASDKLTEGVRQGHLDALVLQDPFNIGYLAVQTMIKKLRNESFEKRVDTGAKLVTRDNIDAPEMQQLLRPELDKWLKE